MGGPNGGGGGSVGGGAGAIVVVAVAVVVAVVVVGGDSVDPGAWLVGGPVVGVELVVGTVVGGTIVGVELVVDVVPAGVVTLDDVDEPIDDVGVVELVDVLVDPLPVDHDGNSQMTVAADSLVAPVGGLVGAGGELASCVEDTVVPVSGTLLISGGPCVDIVTRPSTRSSFLPERPDPAVTVAGVDLVDPEPPLDVRPATDPGSTITTDEPWPPAAPAAGPPPIPVEETPEGSAVVVTGAASGRSPGSPSPSAMAHRPSTPTAVIITSTRGNTVRPTSSGPHPDPLGSSSHRGERQATVGGRAGEHATTTPGTRNGAPTSGAP